MTISERMQDISEKSGLSVAVCRRVLDALSESTLESLVRGENVRIPNIVTLSPYISARMSNGGVFRDTAQVKITCSNTVLNTLEKIDSFDIDYTSNKPEPGIRVSQIPSLS